MFDYFFNSNSSSGSSYMNTFDPFPCSLEGFSDVLQGRPLVSQSLVLDAEMGDLVKAPARVGNKGISEAKALAALKSHSEAERRRRERINAHLDTLRGLVPCTEKVTLKYEGISCWYVTASISILLAAIVVSLLFRLMPM